MSENLGIGRALKLGKVGSRIPVSLNGIPVNLIAAEDITSAKVAVLGGKVYCPANQQSIAFNFDQFSKSRKKLGARSVGNSLPRIPVYPLVDLPTIFQIYSWTESWTNGVKVLEGFWFPRTQSLISPPGGGQIGTIYSYDEGGGVGEFITFEAQGYSVADFTTGQEFSIATRYAVSVRTLVDGRVFRSITVGVLQFRLPNTGEPDFTPQLGSPPFTPPDNFIT